LKEKESNKQKKIVKDVKNYKLNLLNKQGIRVMVFNITFNNLAVSFIGGGNRSTKRNPPICHKSLTNFITYCYTEYTSSERDSNSQC
jgi:hypothetical protein